MILVDSSVWIDWFNNNDTLQTRRLRLLTDTNILLVGDLILAEVLQGFRQQRDFENARVKLSGLEQIDIGGLVVAEQAARNYRRLREMGLTVRKTIDALIATRCIMERIPLLYSDPDFDPFVKHLGLVDVMAEA